MTLEERIAAALRQTLPTPLPTEGAIERAARAVVAALPTADVSDARAITDDMVLYAIYTAPEPLVAVRALLDAQAAAHAAYVIEVRSEYEESLRDSAAEVEELRAEVDHLRKVKASWFEEAQLNMRLMREQATRAATAEADRDACRACIDAVRALCDHGDIHVPIYALRAALGDA